MCPGLYSIPSRRRHGASDRRPPAVAGRGAHGPGAQGRRPSGADARADGGGHARAPAHRGAAEAACGDAASARRGISTARCGNVCRRLRRHRGGRHAARRRRGDLAALPVHGRPFRGRAAGGPGEPARGRARRRRGAAEPQGGRLLAWSRCGGFQGPAHRHHVRAGGRLGAPADRDQQGALRAGHPRLRRGRALGRLARREALPDDRASDGGRRGFRGAGRTGREAPEDSPRAAGARRDAQRVTVRAAPAHALPVRAPGLHGRDTGQAALDAQAALGWGRQGGVPPT